MLACIMLWSPWVIQQVGIVPVRQGVGMCEAFRFSQDVKIRRG